MTKNKLYLALKEQDQAWRYSGRARLYQALLRHEAYDPVEVARTIVYYRQRAALHYENARYLMGVDND